LRYSAQQTNLDQASGAARLFRILIQNRKADLNSNYGVMDFSEMSRLCDESTPMAVTKNGRNFGGYKY
jgi:hypothetical protein